MHPLGAGILGAYSSLDLREGRSSLTGLAPTADVNMNGGSMLPCLAKRIGFLPNNSKILPVEASHKCCGETREFLLIQLVDELHEAATLSDEVWEQLVANWRSAQMLEMMIIVGWYHLISFIANAVQVEQESWAARFPNTSKERSR
jgi:4-carboxymuconolactone decarboxylase